MNIFSNIKVVGLILALIVAGFFFLISNKPRKAPEPLPAPVAAAQTTSSSSFMEEAEKRRNQMLEEKAAIERQEKLLRQRESSVECQFWKQQKSVSSDAKVDEKIVEFCTLPTGNSSHANTSTATSDATESSATSSGEPVAQ